MSHTNFLKWQKHQSLLCLKKKIEFEKYVASTKSVCSWCALYSIPIKMRIVQCFRYLFCSYYNSIIWLDLSMFSFSRCHFQTHFCSFSFLFCYLSIVFKSLACCAQIHWKWNSTCKPIQCGWNSKIKNWIANEKKKLLYSLWIRQRYGTMKKEGIKSIDKRAIMANR